MRRLARQAVGQRLLLAGVLHVHRQAGQRHQGSDPRRRRDRVLHGRAGLYQGRRRVLRPGAGARRPLPARQPVRDLPPWRPPGSPLRGHPVAANRRGRGRPGRPGRRPGAGQVRHRGVQDAQAGLHRRRLYGRGPPQAPPGRYYQRRHLPGRHLPGSQGHPRHGGPGQSGRRLGADPPVARHSQGRGHHQLDPPGAVRRLRPMRDGVRLRCAEPAPLAGGHDHQRSTVQGLWRLLRGLPLEGDHPGAFHPEADAGHAGCNVGVTTMNTSDKTRQATDLVQAGIAALRSGRKVDARFLLGQALEEDPQSEEGWLWLSGAVDTDEERRFCLKQVLSINEGTLQQRQGWKNWDLGPHDPQLHHPPLLRDQHHPLLKHRHGLSGGTKQLRLKLLPKRHHPLRKHLHGLSGGIRNFS